ncbi:MAG: ROK family protein [Planctomycetia bacterium]|nr:MAG: ROK family protein [Planctomycetia bacterium]
MSARTTLGIDIGGTNIKGGVLDDQDRLLARSAVETRADEGFEASFARIVALIDELIAAAGVSRNAIAAVGVGVPGPMDHAAGVVRHAPNLDGWVNIPLRRLLTERTGLPCFVENDANAAAFGEFVGGTQRAATDMVMLTLGTGIGGGVILGGRLVRGRFDNAGEVGHMIVALGGRACPCGQRGCLERYASANAIRERLIEAVRAGEKSSLAPAVYGSEPLTAEDVCRAAQQGDEPSQRVWDEACRMLAAACVNLQHVLNPGLIVLAGGLINAGEALLGPVQSYFKELTWKICEDFPRIEPAVLGGDAGLLGAAALAREALLAAGAGHAR